MSLTCAWPGLASQGTKGTQARELLGAERRAPAFRLSATLSPERARSLRLLPAPQGPPLGDAARAHRRGEGAAPTNWGAPLAARSGLCSEPPHPGRCAGLTPGPPRLSCSPRLPGDGLQFFAVPVGPPPPRARHHGAPVQLLASAAARRPSAPRGAQPGRCEGESPAGSAPQPPALHPRRPARPLCPALGAVNPPGPRGCRGWHGQVQSSGGSPLMVPVGCGRASITEPSLLRAGYGRVRIGLKLRAHRGGVRVPGSQGDLNSHRRGV